MRTNRRNTIRELLTPPTPWDGSIYFAVVSPIGAGRGDLVAGLRSQLHDLGFEVHEIRLVEDEPRFRDVLEDSEFDAAVKERENRYDRLIGLANGTRKKYPPDVLAALAIVERFRLEEADKSSSQHDARLNYPRQAYIFSSIKRPEEIELLRTIYGRSLHVVSAVRPSAQRLNYICEKLANEMALLDTSEVRDEATRLMRLDASEGTDFGQDIRHTFTSAAIFVPSDSRPSIDRAVERYLGLVLGYRFHTPTRDEYGMYIADAASRQSADMSRQVGAAITSAEGDLLTIGWNEVPKAGGGPPWYGDSPDGRDFRRGKDPSVGLKTAVLCDLFGRVQKTDWGKTWNLPESDELRRKIRTVVTQLNADHPDKVLLLRSDVMRSTEYGRTVHAEMMAISRAAALGRTISGGTLFTTVFPCHNCAKHIVASGISRVVYVDPYPKSRVQELHRDAIAVPHDLAGNAPDFADVVKFEQFTGVAPWSSSLFLGSPKRRRDAKDPSKPPVWKKTTATPFKYASNTLDAEAQFTEKYQQIMKQFQEGGKDEEE